MASIGRWRKTKISLTMGFLLLTLFIIAALLIPPAQAYEDSAYSIITLPMWFLIISSSIIGIKIVHASFSKGPIWILGAGLALLNVITIMLLPVIRGYRYYGGYDSLLHVGVIKNMAYTGHFIGTDKFDFYPLIHYLSSIFSQVTNIAPIDLPMLFNVVFLFLFIIFMYLISRELLPDRQDQVYIILLSLIPLFGSEFSNFAPYAKSLYFIPMFIYIYVKRHRIMHQNDPGSSNHRETFTFLLLLIIVFIVMFHILTAAIIIFVLMFPLCLDAVPYLAKRIGRKEYRITKFKVGFDTPITVFFVAVFIGWVTSFSIFRYWMDLYILRLFSETGNSPISQYITQGSSATLLDLLSAFIFRFGIVTAIVIITLLTILKLARGNFFHPKLRSTMRPFLLTTLALALLTGIFILADMGVGPRPMSILIISSTILAGLIIPTLVHSYHNRDAVITSLIVILFVISLLTIHPSPINKEANWQIEETDFSVAQWYAGNEPPNDVFYYGRFDPLVLYGDQSAIVHAHHLPDHLCFEDTKYWDYNITIVIDEKARTIYPSLLGHDPNSWRLTPSDFDTIEFSNRYDKVYVNHNDIAYIYWRGT